MDDGGEVHSRDFAGRPLKGDSEPAAGIHYDNMSAGSDGRSFDIRNGRGYRTEDYQRRRRDERNRNDSRNYYEEYESRSANRSSVGRNYDENYETRSANRSSDYDENYESRSANRSSVGKYYNEEYESRSANRSSVGRNYNEEYESRSANRSSVGRNYNEEHESRSANRSSDYDEEYESRSASRSRYRSRSPSYDRSESYYGPPQRSRERSSSKQSRGRHSLSRSRSPARKKAEVEREWPPCFETDGSAFVFDTRSAMFYESQSNFFYDPKNKLYYGNKKGAYFRYDETQDPPFVEFQKSPTTLAPEEGLDIIPQPTAIAVGQLKPTIAIKLKTKKLKKQKASTQVKSAPLISKVEKKQIANIEKWNDKQAEIKAIVSEYADVNGGGGANQKVKRTAEGKWICVVCKRKFPTLERLRQHEKVSDLHKSNLAKLAKANASDGKRKEFPQGTYTDRAKKRRNMHGDERTLVKPGLDQKYASGDASPVSDTLGSSNIGNQMLKKMGWKEIPSSGPQNDIRKDWQRIESLASRPPHR